MFKLTITAFTFMGFVAIAAILVPSVAWYSSSKSLQITRQELAAAQEELLVAHKFHHAITNALSNGEVMKVKSRCIEVPSRSESLLRTYCVDDYFMGSKMKVWVQRYDPNFP